MTSTLTRETFYPHPVDRVWRAITEADRVTTWLMDTDLRPEVGHRFTLRGIPAPPWWDGIVHCLVLAVEPPRMLRFTWRGGPLDTVVTWRLVRAERHGLAGTTMYLEQSGFDLDDPGQRAAWDALGGGWVMKMDELLLVELNRMAEV